MSSFDSKRRGREQRQRCDDDDDAAAKRARPRQKHLYLVMDDWEMGYSIHKLDVDEFESDAGGGGENKPRRLPETCALRIEAPADRSPAILASIGTKILFITDRLSDGAPMLIYDTETASLAVGPRLTPALRPVGFMFIVPVGQRLYAFNPRRGDQQCSFEVLSRAPRDEEDEFRLSRRAERWSVGSVPAPMPLGKHETVTAYAVHPDGRTIFVSARNWSRRAGEREGGHPLLRHPQLGVDVARRVEAPFPWPRLLRRGAGRVGRALPRRVHLLLCGPAVRRRNGRAARVEAREEDDVPRGPGAACGAAYRCHAHVHGQQQVLPR